MCEIVCVYKIVQCVGLAILTLSLASCVRVLSLQESTTKVVNMCVCTLCRLDVRVLFVLQVSRVQAVVWCTQAWLHRVSMSRSDLLFLGAQQLTDGSTPAPWRPWDWQVFASVVASDYM